MKNFKKFFFLLFSIGIISCQNSTNNSTDKKPSANDSLSPEEICDKTSMEGRFENSDELNFVLKKLSQFRKLQKDKPSSENMKNDISKLPKDVFKNGTIINWTATLDGIDDFKGVNADISMTILDEYKIGQRTVTKNGEDHTFDSRVTIGISQGDSPKMGYKGIPRKGELWNKIENLGTPCEIIFSAKVVDVTNSTEKTGINFSTIIYIELTDIKRANK